jgi:potassium-transporting ATPase potassium-binding subunit
MAFQLSHHGTVPMATGSAMEGIEQRFGIVDSTIFGDAGTLTSDGAIDSMHDSYTSLGGLITMFNMQLGEVAPGGIGSGLYGILLLAVISVFIAGLMVGRTPEYLGKKIRPREMTLSTSFILATELAVLVGCGIAMAFPGPRAAMANTGPHGLSEVLYAFTSAANTNGSAFAGLSANTTFYNTALGLAMLLGRYLPFILVLALAGSLASQGHTPASVGTLPTHRPQFVGLVAAVTVILCALTFLPALALGPLAEGIH